MSSPPQLHLSLHTNTSFKRSFEEFGFDLESPAPPRVLEPTDGSSSSTASSASSSTSSPDVGDENRRKRARSASSLSDPVDRSSEASSSSTLSSFDSQPASDSFSHRGSSQAPRRHLLLDLGLGRGLGSSVALGLGMAAAELQLDGHATSEPPPRIPTPELLESEDVDMPDVDMGFARHEEHEEEEPASPAEHIRRSVDRFNAFDRHINVLRSSSPPVIPLPTSLSSRQVSRSPPTLPPLPLVDLGLDPDDEDDDHEHIPSTVTTNTSTPPRLDLNLPPATSLSSGPNSPADETQFRQRLDSAIDGLGGGNLHFEAPISPVDRRADDEPSFDRYFEPVREALASSSNASGTTIASTSAHRTRPFADTPLFDWTPSTLDWSTVFPARSPGPSAEAAQPQRPPPLAPWRPLRSPTINDTVPDTTAADIRRLVGHSFSPPPRQYPRPASLAAPLSSDAQGEGDLVEAYLDLHRSHTSTRAWESALDRARALREQRERERERDRIREREQRERDRARERELEREREDEAERERDHPWSLDSIWDTSAGVESFTSSARPRPWESLTLRTRRELADNERELEMELTRRRAMQRQFQQTLDRERDRQRDEQHERAAASSSVSRAARYLESGLVDPREAPVNPSVPPRERERRLRPPTDISNPFSVSWAARRGVAQATEDEVPSPRPRVRRSRSSSQSREGMDWLGRVEHETSDLFDEWLPDRTLPLFEDPPPAPRSVTPRTGAASSGTYGEPDGMDYTRRSAETSSSSEHWRHRTTGGWQPQLALSPQSTAQPTRTTTHARAQSIPSALSSGTAQPSIHRLRSRLHAPRAAGIGSANSLVAESAAAIRRSEARSELLERLRTLPIPTDLERLRTLPIPPEPELESDWDALMTGRTRNSQDYDVDMDSDDDEAPPPRRPVELLSLRPSASRSSLRFRARNDPSPARQIPPLRVPSGSIRPRPPMSFEDEPEEQQPTASSSGLNSRRPLSIHPRRPIVRLRQHPISGEISPPAPASATASVDRRHASWEAPSRDAAVSSTYEYLSALSHGFDSQYSSISDMAHTIASNTTNAPPSPMWGESESPFSTLFARSPGPSPSVARNSSSPRRPELDRQLSFPSLPPPDLGGDFDRSEEILRSADTDAARAAAAPATPTSESPTNSYYPARPPTPPSSNSNPYTGPFRLTMQRRDEAARRAAAQRRVPEPPSIPPLYFGREFESNTPATATMSQEGSGSETRHRLLAQLSAQRPHGYQRPRSPDAERRFSLRGPPSSSQAQAPDADPRRFFTSRPTPTSSVTRDPPEPRHERRYSATDMHNVLARQTRLEGSRLAPDSPSGYRPSDTDTTDLTPHDGFSMSTSRARQLISRYHSQYHAQAEAEANDFSTSASPWAALPARRSDPSRAEAEARRRRMAARTESELPQFRHRALRGDPAFHAMFGLNGATARFRRRALGDYMRDEDFDASYETLLSLGGIIGEAKAKGTEASVIAGLDAASYKDWATPESDQRCPICLDDYQPTDPVMKLGDCRHWLHKECLEQWLKGASTCPVCRKDVKGKARRAPHRHHHHHPGPSRRDSDGPDGPGGPRPPPGGSGSGGDIPHINWLNFLRD